MRIVFFILVSVLSLKASDWKKMYGKYVTLEFNPGYESLADSIVNMADRAIPRLAALQGVSLSSFDKTKTRIILTDAPDISNGFAIENTVVLYVRASMYLDRWSGPHTWHKMVLEHELTHHVTFRALWRKSNYLGLASSLSVPRWFYEGTAQYFVESWTPYRGDIYMKRAVLNGNLKYSTLDDLSDGRLLYASGHAFIRYLADQYGDSSLIKLVNYDKDSYFYNFNDAFKHVYGKSVQEVFDYFLRHMIVYYGNQAADHPLLKNESLLPKFGYRDLQVIPLTSRDSTYLVRTVLKQNHLYSTVILARIIKGKQEVVKTITDNLATEIYLSPDQTHIAYGRYNIGNKINQTSINYQWSIYNIETNKNSGIIDNIRAFKAAFTHENRLILATTEGTNSIIKLFKNDGTFIKDIYNSALAIDAVLGLADGSIIFEAQQKNAQRDLFIIKDGVISQLSDDAADNRNPFELKNNLVFNQMVDNNPVVSIFNLKTKETRILINMQDPVVVQHSNPDSNTIIVAFRDAGKRLLFAEFSIDSLLKKPVVPTHIDRHPSYESWTTKIATVDTVEKPDPSLITQKRIEDELFPQGSLIQLQTLPIPVYQSKEGAGLFLVSLWTEAMQRQIVFVNSYLLFNDWQASYLSLLHYLKVFNLDMTSLYYHGPGILTRVNGQFTQLVHDYAEFSLAHIAYMDGNSYLPYAIKGAYKIDNFKEASGPADYSYHGPSLTAAFGYELPSSYHNIFPKRALKGSITFFKSLHSDWDFSTIDLSFLAASNLYSEKIGLTTQAHFISTSGDASPSAVTGIDQDYSYAFPRDYRNTKTIRGIRKNIFGDKLIWNSTELTLLLAQQTPMKILFLPVNELALSGFLDLARVENSDFNLTNDLYSYGAELSIGFGVLRLGAGYAVGNIDGSERNGEYYGRLNITIDTILSAAGLE